MPFFCQKKCDNWLRLDEVMVGSVWMKWLCSVWMKLRCTWRQGPRRWYCFTPSSSGAHGTVEQGPGPGHVLEQCNWGPGQVLDVRPCESPRPPGSDWGAGGWKGTSSLQNGQTHQTSSELLPAEWSDSLTKPHQSSYMQNGTDFLKP